MDRNEHLQWAKTRALEYADAGDVNNAFASIVLDLGKHPDTEGHTAMQLGFALLMNGHLSTKEQMRKFIEGIG